jgi:hypothetical protein
MQPDIPSPKATPIRVPAKPPMRVLVDALEEFESAFVLERQQDPQANVREPVVARKPD